MHVVGFLEVGTSGSPYSLRCVVGTSTTQQFHFVVLPKNPQHNNLKLLCCGLSGRWHLWASVRPEHRPRLAQRSDGAVAAAAAGGGDEDR